MRRDKTRHSQGIPAGPVVENSPANAGDGVQSLVWDDPTG